MNTYTDATRPSDDWDKIREYLFARLKGDFPPLAQIKIDNNPLSLVLDFTFTFIIGGKTFRFSHEIGLDSLYEAATRGGTDAIATFLYGHFRDQLRAQLDPASLVGMRDASALYSLGNVPDHFIKRVQKSAPFVNDITLTYVGNGITRYVVDAGRYHTRIIEVTKQEIADNWDGEAGALVDKLKEIIHGEAFNYSGEQGYQLALGMAERIQKLATILPEVGKLFEIIDLYVKTVGEAETHTVDRLGAETHNVDRLGVDFSPFGADDLTVLYFQKGRGGPWGQEFRRSFER